MTSEDIASRLSGRGVKPTAMRILVYKTLMDCVRPVSLREIDDKMVTAERSTIFRTLTLLLQQGLIHAIEDGSGAVRYEVCHGHDHCSLDDQHAHFFAPCASAPSASTTWAFRIPWFRVAFMSHRSTISSRGYVLPATGRCDAASPDSALHRGLAHYPSLSSQHEKTGRHVPYDPIYPDCGIVEWRLSS